MSGLSASHCCDGRRKRERKSISPCYRSEPPARVGAVQTHPPHSLPGSGFALAVHPPRVPGCPCREHKGHLAAGRAAPTGQRGGELKQSKFPVVSPCLQRHRARPCPRNASMSQGARGSCLAVVGGGGVAEAEAGAQESGVQGSQQRGWGRRWGTIFWGSQNVLGKKLGKKWVWRRRFGTGNTGGTCTLGPLAMGTAQQGAGSQWDGHCGGKGPPLPGRLPGCQHGGKQLIWDSS